MTSSKRIKRRIIVPVVFLENGNADSPQLLAKAEAYLSERSGRKVKLSSVNRVWMELEVTGKTVLAVRGVMALSAAVDIPVFHTDDGHAAAALSKRMLAYLADRNIKGHAFVFIEPGVEEEWRALLKAIGAEHAHRWKFPTDPGLGG